MQRPKDQENEAPPEKRSRTTTTDPFPQQANHQQHQQHQVVDSSACLRVRNYHSIIRQCNRNMEQTEACFRSNDSTKKPKVSTIGLVTNSLAKASRQSSPSAFDGQYELYSSRRYSGTFKPLKILGRGTYGVAYLVQYHHQHQQPDTTTHIITPNGGAVSAMGISEPIVQVNRCDETGRIINTFRIPREDLFVCKVEKIRQSSSPQPQSHSHSDAGPKLLVQDLAKQHQERSSHEVHILSNLAHPNIINFVDFYVDKKKQKQLLYIEYVDGGDLYHDLERRRESGVFMNEREVLHIFVQVVLAIEYCHRHNILHRDIKSDNILISKRDFVKVTDFGTAKQFSCDVSHTVDSTQVGTPNYLSPEICKGDPHSQKTDMWSLGVLLYELLTTGAYYPFSPSENVPLKSFGKKILTDGPRPLERNLPNGDRISDPTWNLLKDLLNPEPDRRPTALEFFTKNESYSMLPVLDGYVSDFNRKLVDVTDDNKPSTQNTDRALFEMLTAHASLIHGQLPVINQTLKLPPEVERGIGQKMELFRCGTSSPTNVSAQTPIITNKSSKATCNIEPVVGDTEICHHIQTSMCKLTTTTTTTTTNNNSPPPPPPHHQHHGNPPLHRNDNIENGVVSRPLEFVAHIETRSKNDLLSPTSNNNATRMTDISPFGNVSCCHRSFSVNSAFASSRRDDMLMMMNTTVDHVARGAVGEGRWPASPGAASSIIRSAPPNPLMCHANRDLHIPPCANLVHRKRNTSYLSSFVSTTSSAALLQGESNCSSPLSEEKRSSGAQQQQRQFRTAMTVESRYREMVFMATSPDKEHTNEKINDDDDDG